MELKKLERILDNSAVGKLKDDNGWPIAVIAFLSMQDAEDTYRFLREIKQFRHNHPDFDFRGELRRNGDTSI